MSESTGQTGLLAGIAPDVLQISDALAFALELGFIFADEAANLIGHFE